MTSLRILSQANRECGSCQACCIGTERDMPWGIDAVGTRCRHAGHRGCVEYATRPQLCRDFRCMWLLGMGEPHQRPDVTGVIVTIQPCGLGPKVREANELVEGAIGRQLREGPDWALVAQEVWEGALSHEPGARLVSELSRGAPVFTLTVTGRKGLRAPDAWVRVVLSDMLSQMRH